jgi:hypothetical protein
VLARLTSHYVKVSQAAMGLARLTCPILQKQARTQAAARSSSSVVVDANTPLLDSTSIAVDVAPRATPGGGHRGQCPP